MAVRSRTHGYLFPLKPGQDSLRALERWQNSRVEIEKWCKFDLWVDSIADTGMVGLG